MMILALCHTVTKNTDMAYREEIAGIYISLCEQDINLNPTLLNLKKVAINDIFNS